MMRRIFGTIMIVAALAMTAHIQSVHALSASLSVVPPSGTYQVGDTFDVVVTVTTDSAVNAVSGALTYPADILEISDISRADSIFTVWPKEPSWLTASGKAFFEGVLFSPGYTGSGANVVTVHFRAVRSGTATVGITSASVLANDGLGTNILTSVQNATFTIGGTGAAEEPVVAPPAEPTPPSSPLVPAAPTVRSSTHPDPTSCYTATDATFVWNVPPGAVGVNVYGDQNPTTDPGTRPDGLFRTWTFDNVDDGQWYFHIRLQNSYGWGPPAHMPFCIDTKSPVLDALEVYDATTDGVARAAIKVRATDEGTGIRQFVVTVDDGAPIVVEGDRIGPDLPYFVQVPPGEHTFTVAAVDLAGNRDERTAATRVTEPSPLFGRFTPLIPAGFGVPTFWELVRSSEGVVGMLMIAAVVLAILSAFSAWHGFGIFRRRVRRDVELADEKFHEAFGEAHEKLRKQIERIERVQTKRKLTRSEQLLHAKLQDNLANIEKKMHAEFKKLEREVA